MALVYIAALMRLVRFVFFALSLAGFAACENEVMLLEEEPAVPIVYGTYRASSDVQTLTVTKTFRFAEGAGARESAATPDSVYYGPDELTVVATRVDTTVEIIAERYDAAAEGIVREPGSFSAGTNIAYRFDASPLRAKTGDSIKITLLRADQPIASVTQAQLPALDFPGGSRAPSEMYPLSSTTPFGVRWLIPNSDARDLISVMEVGFNFVFTEIQGANETERTVYWPAVRELETVTAANVQLDGIFPYLRNELVADPSITRRFEYIQLVITAGDRTFDEYQTLLNANRSGLTSTQELPPFSNIDGAVGLYGSLSQVAQDVGAQLSPGGFDALFGTLERNGVSDFYEMAPYNFFQ